MVNKAHIGVIDGTGISRRVELNRLFPYAIDDVCKAITDPSCVANWFAKCDIDPHEGGCITLDFGETVVTGRIKTYMPPHVFSYTVL